VTARLFQELPEDEREVEVARFEEAKEEHKRQMQEYQTREHEEVLLGSRSGAVCRVAVGSIPIFQPKTYQQKGRCLVKATKGDGVCAVSLLSSMDDVGDEDDTSKPAAVKTIAPRPVRRARRIAPAANLASGSPAKRKLLFISPAKRSGRLSTMALRMLTPRSAAADGAAGGQGGPTQNRSPSSDEQGRRNQMRLIRVRGKADRASIVSAPPMPGRRRSLAVLGPKAGARSSRGGAPREAEAGRRLQSVQPKLRVLPKTKRTAPIVRRVVLLGEVWDDIEIMRAISNAHSEGAATAAPAAE